MIVDLLEQSVIEYIDYYFAKMLLERVGIVDDDQLLALAYLSYCSRLGHLCIQFDGEILHPQVNQIYKLTDYENDSELVIKTIDLEEVEQKIKRGFVSLDKNLYEISSFLTQGECTKPICRCNNLVYLQKNWVYETSIASFLKLHLASKPTVCFEKNNLQQILDLHTLLTKEQKEAIFKALYYHLVFINGGPGTGKTFTAVQLLKIYLELLPKETANIIITAPTGKAAANLGSKVSGYASSSISIKIKTLHALLKPLDRDSNFIIPADLIIIDEVSMMDARLMALFLKTVNQGTRIIFLGDIHQLPPIGSGTILKDILESLNETYQAALTICQRTDLKEILQLAEGIKQGKFTNMIDDLKNPQTAAVTQMSLDQDSLREKCDRIVGYVKRFYPNPSVNQVIDEEVIAQFESFCLLSPMRKGLLGAEHLNEALKKEFLLQSKNASYFITPILIVKNDYQIELFNGDVGVAVYCQRSKTSYALFHSRSKEQSFTIENKSYRKIPLVMLPLYEPAYCLSVHKSQGSEYNHVVLVLPLGSESFGREMLYTAVTRSRKRFELFASDQTIKNTINTHAWCLSGLKEQIRTFVH